MCSILFGDTMVPNIEYDYILLLGVVFYIRNINTTQMFPGQVAGV